MKPLSTVLRGRKGAPNGSAAEARELAARAFFVAVQNSCSSLICGRTGSRLKVLLLCMRLCMVRGVHVLQLNHMTHDLCNGTFEGLNFVRIRSDSWRERRRECGWHWLGRSELLLELRDAASHAACDQVGSGFEAHNSLQQSAGSGLSYGLSVCLRSAYVSYERPEFVKGPFNG